MAVSVTCPWMIFASNSFEDSKCQSHDMIYYHGDEWRRPIAFQCFCLAIYRIWIDLQLYNLYSPISSTFLFQLPLIDFQDVLYEIFKTLTIRTRLEWRVIQGDEWIHAAWCLLFIRIVCALTAPSMAFIISLTLLLLVNVTPESFIFFSVNRNMQDVINFVSSVSTCVGV